MKYFAIFAILGFAACQGHDKKPDPVPAALPLKPAEPAPVPAPTPEPLNLQTWIKQMQSTGNTYKSACTETANGSVEASLFFSKDQTLVVRSARYSDRFCISFRLSVTREGTYSIAAVDERKAQVSIAFTKDFWLLRYPSQIRKDACPVADERDLRGLWRSSDECKLALPTYEAEWSLAEGDEGLIMPGVSDDLLGFTDGYEGTFRKASGALSVPEQLRCQAQARLSLYDAPSRNCRAIEGFISASPESVIEYQKDTGLYPSVKVDRRILAKADGAMQYRVDYDFACDVSNARTQKSFEIPNMFVLGMEDESMYFVQKGKHHLEILGREDLTLRNEIGQSIAWLFGTPQVKDGCSLTIDVQSKKLAD